ncbi:MAG: DUF5606 domain-containing protein [Bacteroidales bacterium]|jgi:hypothetical protein|nr:DUF5606 domain-containing protein [Bacteroidales bacterium]
MNLKEILSVPGKSGLYKLVSKGKNSFIIESLADGSRMPIFASHQSSALNDICVFTSDRDVPLKEVFERIFQDAQGDKVAENKIKIVSELKNYMEKILPDYDKNRVHVSDMKKIFTWYNILHEHNLLSFDETNVDDETKADNDTQTNDEIKTEEENTKTDNEN